MLSHIALAAIKQATSAEIRYATRELPNVTFVHLADFTTFSANNMRNNFQSLNPLKKAKPFATLLEKVSEDIRAVFRKLKIGEKSPLPENLYTVDGKVWRSAKPSHFELEQIAQLKSKFSVIVDCGKPTHKELLERQQFVEKFGIEYKNIRLSENKPPTDEQIQDLFDTVDKAKGLVLVHCWRGIDRTGIMSALLRLREGHNVANVIGEMKALGHKPEEFPALVDYLEQNATRIYEKWGNKQAA